MVGLLLITCTFSSTCKKPPIKRYSETAMSGSEGDLGKNLQEGGVHGSTLELLRGMVYIHVLAS